MSEVNIVAILYPASGKLDRMRELMKPMIKSVYEKEDYTLRYMMTEQINHDSGEPDIVMIETYKSKDGADQHTATDYFKELFGTFEKEGIMAKAPYLAITKSVQGFDTDRKLI
ncbi:hypothetical protein Slin15195_G109570 [Septoria linicola]|uniref:ABM domain-containing protein n=1 Tax=Septoria linicola TaxID=215465 RepID=A0A9Q9B2C0_9PEZI|nr:hypothetical protein Slin14017_G107920 [Septoria linicola]USW57638.1 hypothetical protein Slin15195_G109570 [Septoria linicola]